MKLMWLCNMVPGAVQEKLGGSVSGGLWVDHVLSDLRKLPMDIRILCPGKPGETGELDAHCSYTSFTEGLPYRYLPELEAWYRKELESWRPDVIHIWGTEYGHTLAMVNAAEALGLLDRVAVSIQGLCSVVALHYAEGVPELVCRGNTFRDLVRRDNIRWQQKKFALRGELEEQALRKVRHVIGRTDWDRACTSRINPDAIYHFCNETLRQPFYEGSWTYESCRKHRIFASSCIYPPKGFHFLLEALAEVSKVFPDVSLAVPGKSYLETTALRRSGYQKYLTDLTRRHGLEDKIEFLGSLSARQMREQYLRANVFTLPSTVENSPNSLGEAMLLGVPCVTSDVGGVTNMLTHGREGYVYQTTASYMLAHYIMTIFEQQEKAEAMGATARARAAQTHDPNRNLETLLEIYRSLME